MADLIVAPVADMDDETVMKHLEFRHEDDLKMAFKPEPDRTERRLNNAETWRTYHNSMHRLYPRKYEHTHRDTVRGS